MNRVYLIAGGTGDLGMEFLRETCDDGDIALVQGAVIPPELAALAKERPNIHPFAVDLTDSGAVDAFIEMLRRDYPAPTHYVHLPALHVVNAKFRNFDEDYFETDFSVQVRSAVRLCKAFVPVMAKARCGRVLFVLTSYLLGMPPKNVEGYVMAKSALQGLAKSLAADYAPFGVTVNCVAPGMIETSFLKDTSNLIIEASAEQNPMKRNARTTDVVPAMKFLLSDEAGYITGVTLPITGGAIL